MPGHLAKTILADPALPVDAGSAALTAIADVADLDLTALEAIEPHLPPDRQPDLDLGIAAIARRLTIHRLIGANPADRAQLCADLSHRLTNAGLRSEALHYIEEAVRIRRSLALGGGGRGQGRSGDRAARLRRSTCCCPQAA